MRAVYSASPISVGQSVSAELPNITGSLGGGLGIFSGAFYYGGDYSGAVAQGGGSMDARGNLDASLCSSIYKDSATTVVPESLITNFYIKY